MSEGYIAYKLRWWVLATVAMLNMSINALWISYAPIATKTADYFEVTPSKVDILLSVGYLFGIPVGALSLWMVPKLGLKWVFAYINLINDMRKIIVFKLSDVCYT